MVRNHYPVKFRYVPILGWWVFLLFLILSISGCEKIWKDSFFLVKVVEENTESPVYQATIEGGLDWEFFSVKTNMYGVAAVPSHALNKRAVIFRDNFYPLIVKNLRAETYKLTSMPIRLREIGEVLGKSLKFTEDTIITLTYQGGYRVYTYSKYTVSEAFMTRISPLFKHTLVRGDTLWYTTHDDGVYVYSISDPFAPVQLAHYDIPGYLKGIFVFDSLLILSESYGLISIYSIHPDGSYSKLSEIGQGMTLTFKVISKRYIVNLSYGTYIEVYDILDPSNPQLVWSENLPEGTSGFWYSNYLLLIPSEVRTHEDSIVTYSVYDFSNPTAPLPSGEFTADSRIFQLINDTLAVGSYLKFSASVCVLIGDMNGSFRSVAMLSGPEYYDTYGGNYSSYFIAGGSLWKLQVNP